MTQKPPRRVRVGNLPSSEELSLLSQLHGTELEADENLWALGY